MYSRLRPSVRLVGWYITSEMTTPWRREEGPSGSFDNVKKPWSMVLNASAKVFWLLAKIVFGVLARSRTLFTVSVFVMICGIGVVLKMIVLESTPNTARKTETQLLMV